MNEGEKTINYLPISTQSKLRSTQILTSLPQIISELIQNSLDAGARQVDIGVDCEEWECWVRDDGIGIKKDDLRRLGKGGRYTTSKAYSLASLYEVNTFGFRGEALASAADLCCLEIASRTARSRESWSIILKGGQGLYDGPSLRWRRESSGTVVCLRDIFYNLPVRRLSHSTPQRTLELVRKEIETFAIVSPHVSFSLENTTKAGGVRSDRSKVMSVPKTKSSLATFRHLFGRAFAEHVDEIDETLGTISIQGFISLEGAHSRGFQYLYLNRHPLSYSNLQRLIEQKFVMSTFGKHAFDERGETLERSSARRSPRKSEKKPIYVLNITLPPNQVDNCLEPAKSAVYISSPSSVTDFLSSVIRSFLVKHGFATSTTPQRTQLSFDRSGSPSPRKKRKIASFDESLGSIGPRLNRIKLLNPSSSQSSAYTDTGNDPHTKTLVIHPDVESSELENVVWTDPQTGMKFVVDSRTGNSRPLNTGSGHSETTSEDKEFVDNPRRTLNTLSSSKKGSAQEDAPQWIRNALELNDVFTSREPGIPALNLTSQISHVAGEHDPCDTHSYTRWKDVLAGTQESIHSTRFGKDAIRDAVVLGQVDKKFIACTVDTANQGVERVPDADDQSTRNGRTLILIDQHAADERVRVERFLKDLCFGFLNHELPIHESNADVSSAGVETRMLTPPFPVLLTRHEATQIVQSADLQNTLERWGFSFSNLDKCKLPTVDDLTNNVFQRKPQSSGYIQLLASSVPEILADKLISGDELRDVLKGFITHLDLVGCPSTQLPPSSQRSQDENLTWQRAMRWCPKELLDLVNSKACRGAIMFNDPLSLEQCERLLRQLADTAFPFQCAHGRPSLVPLTETKHYTLCEGVRSSRAIKSLQWDRVFSS